MGNPKVAITFPGLVSRSVEYRVYAAWGGDSPVIADVQQFAEAVGFNGHTVTYGRGIWEGVEEPCVILTAQTTHELDYHVLRGAIDRLCDKLGQDAVQVTACYLYAQTIYKRGYHAIA